MKPFLIYAKLCCINEIMRKEKTMSCLKKSVGFLDSKSDSVVFTIENFTLI